MAGHQTWLLTCDGECCQATFVCPDGGGAPRLLSEVRGAALAAGWTSVDEDSGRLWPRKRDYCPACSAVLAAGRDEKLTSAGRTV